MNTHWIWKNEIPPQTCDMLVKEFSSKEMVKGLVGNKPKPDVVVRNNDVIFAPNKHAAEFILFRYAIMANKAAEWNYDIINFVEPVQVSRYASNEFYSGHIDVQFFENGLQRKLTCVCLLSDEFEGGEFKLLDMDMKLEKGDVMVFPSFLFHNVMPVTKGERWSLVGWMSGPRFI